MKIAFEGLLIFFIMGVSLLMIGIPVIKIIRMLMPRKTDSLAEAKVRLEAARKEKEAARLNKETEKLYSEIYAEVLEDDSLEKESDRKNEQR